MLWALMWGAVGLLGAGALLLAAMAVVGSFVPTDHVASVSVVVKQPPEAVFDLLADAAGHASWAEGVTGVEALPPVDGRPAWRQRMGRNSFVLVTTRSERPTALVREIRDDHGPFSGRWEYRLSPEGDGCRLSLTEHGHVRGAIPRCVMRYMVGYELYIRKHLASVARRFGEAVTWA